MGEQDCARQSRRDGEQIIDVRLGAECWTLVTEQSFHRNERETLNGGRVLTAVTKEKECQDNQGWNLEKGMPRRGDSGRKVGPDMVDDGKRHRGPSRREGTMGCWGDYIRRQDGRDTCGDAVFKALSHVPTRIPPHVTDGSDEPFSSVRYQGKTWDKHMSSTKVPCLLKASQSLQKQGRYGQSMTPSTEQRAKGRESVADDLSAHVDDGEPLQHAPYTPSLFRALGLDAFKTSLLAYSLPMPWKSSLQFPLGAEE
ncbi:hypothetical protein BDP55DRAFT_629925 [Colletotrichum godetiae]|uniref:Uncharacterized protein n=1 Tax=Colletotrichum godetiae TaxID=1209918 RepID=A0AAJ0ARB4_9PEZI|nr:uncharacterized protein BDP55DRAFT_629925 [Colletotrichum godetiae]KAK1688328.1 hypothetical protein BDP55DRAFT_629925 [Colletotrichum godetiae]